MPPAHEPFHLVIAHAAPVLPDGAPLPPLPPLPQLESLMKGLRLADTVSCDDDAPDTPLERVLARAHGLPGEPGHVPWAAFDTGTLNVPCAWLRPCHWQLGLDHVALLPPDDLELSDAESRALLAAVQPLLQDDGLTLRYHRPDGWLAQGELLRGLRAWSMARAAQQPLTRHVLAQSAVPEHAARLGRLQNELQMLLYTHPVNDAREQARQRPVNALWIEGAGVLDHAIGAPAGLRVEQRLAPAGTPDLTAWQSAWRAIDADSVAQLRRAREAGQDVQLTLCGPRRALTLQTGRGIAFQISSLLRPQRLSELRQQL